MSIRGCDDQRTLVRHSAHLNEHDANQGAQSSGEFLGMTGNSGWYLIGAGGATIFMVILLWGLLGLSSVMY